MSPTLASALSARDYARPDSVEAARDAEDQLLTQWVALSREVPRGSVSATEQQCAKDLLAHRKPTFAKLLRCALIAIHRGADARVYGEIVADVLGAAVATVLPVSEASLAETLAECHTNPLQWRADRPDAPPEALLEAAKALEDEARAAKLAAMSYRRAWRERVRREAGL